MGVAAFPGAEWEWSGQPNRRGRGFVPSSLLAWPPMLFLPFTPLWLSNSFPGVNLTLQSEPKVLSTSLFYKQEVQ